MLQLRARTVYGCMRSVGSKEMPNFDEGGTSKLRGETMEVSIAVTE